MKINDIFEIKIEKLVFGGEGLGYFNDMVIFVPMSVPGDILKVKVISIKKTYARALIEEIISPSKDRVEGNKISFEDFSGADFSMIKYEKQIYYKSLILKDFFKKYEIKNIDVVSSENKINYRNKVAEPFVKINSIITTGFYKKKSHEIFVSDEIVLRSKVASEILKKLLFKINEYSGKKREFKVYNEISKSGFLKNCIIRNNEKNEIMLVIVVTNSNISNLKKVLKELYIENENIKSVYISIKEKEDNIIFGEKFILIEGNDYLTEEILGINFKIYPDSFFQINKKQTINLYKDAISLLGDYKDKIVIDAFSGTGTIAMILSKKAKKVIGIELVKSSVLAARNTARENNIKNVEFLVGKVEEKIFKIIEKNDVDCIVFDPPRKGIDESVLSSIVKSNINKIVYISCNPSTLLRDVDYLTNNSYKIKYLKGYDMFPQTHHIETLVLLERNNND